jgi:hypothetical protein
MQQMIRQVIIFFNLAHNNFYCLFKTKVFFFFTSNPAALRVWAKANYLVVVFAGMARVVRL